MPQGPIPVGVVVNQAYPNVECPASSTTALGTAGAIGDQLVGVLVIPGTTSPGDVQLQDGTASAVTVFTGGASSVGSLVPFFIPWNSKSVNGGWSVITGANVTAVAFGNFA